tara:strand:+ start:3159 stop:4154 length:996 start_codon:yes stop_codon:yes gene_type:complete
MNETTIVTGGAGFIGSHLVERLLEIGCVVTVIDNCSTGRLENLAHLLDHDNLRIVQADISNAQGLGDLFQNVDWVFHLAALADIVPSIEDPITYFNSNIVGTANVVQAATKGKVSRFVYAASSSCYGIPDEYPTGEDAEIRPQYPYALTKRLGEEVVMHWSQVYNLPAISLRLFNVYGPRSRTSGTYGAVFGVFLAQKLANKPFTVVGDGKQTRDFTYVSDVVSAFIRSAQSDHIGEILNVGSGNTYSVNRLIELLGGDVVHIPHRPGEPECTFADIKKITEKLDWLPSVSLEEGVNNMLENIEYWRKAPVWTPDSISQATKAWFENLDNR